MLIFLACRLFMVTLMWFVNNLLNIVFSALRGSAIVVEEFLALSRQQGTIAQLSSEAKGTVTVAIAVLGIYIQLRGWLLPPFPINLLLAPFSILNNIIGIAAAYIM